MTRSVHADQGVVRVFEAGRAPGHVQGLHRGGGSLQRDRGEVRVQLSLGVAAHPG